MSNRERWTVYPLLFLALGVSLRDKITDNFEVHSITCEDLAVKGRDGKSRVRLFLGGPAQSAGLVLYGQNGNAAISLRTNEDGSSGRLAVYSADGKPQIIAKSMGKAGAIETFASSGVPQVVLNSSNRGGLVTTVDNERNLILQLGHEAQASGLFAVESKTGATSAVPFLPQAQPHARAQDAPPKNAQPADGQQPNNARSDDGTDLGQPPEPLPAEPPKNDQPKPEQPKQEAPTRD